MTDRLAGKVVLVTGAGQDIGRGIALALAQGALVVTASAAPARRRRCRRQRPGRWIGSRIGSAVLTQVTLALDD
ncbi:hypothetical protein FRACA_4290003 [Frankia canadensis]|uniref:Uncharacterized protein n=1 Tax=Frankia canadensis TaxID=1836972 RepID=A0A2I2KX74_9ACTN|nr:hypothetical protein FRACA_4290003 [Frankia canadensis]SOU57546.1 hypothetical protein FRACA_4290003 [Frankia canadensis]